MFICRVLKGNGEVVEELKMKGVKVTEEVAEMLDQGTIFDMVKHPDKSLTLPQYPIKRNFMKASLRSLSEPMTKHLKMSSCKRHILLSSDYLDSAPYGLKC